MTMTQYSTFLKKKTHTKFNALLVSISCTIFHQCCHVTPPAQLAVYPEVTPYSVEGGRTALSLPDGERLFLHSTFLTPLSTPPSASFVTLQIDECVNTWRLQCEKNNVAELGWPVVGLFYGHNIVWMLLSMLLASVFELLLAAPPSECSFFYSWG